MPGSALLVLNLFFDVLFFAVIRESGGRVVRARRETGTDRRRTPKPPVVVLTAAGGPVYVQRVVPVHRLASGADARRAAASTPTRRGTALICAYAKTRRATRPGPLAVFMSLLLLHGLQ